MMSAYLKDLIDAAIAGQRPPPGFRMTEEEQRTTPADATRWWVHFGPVDAWGLLNAREATFFVHLFSSQATVRLATLRELFNRQ